jgi:uncharacterized protein (UPF0248 family)
MYLKDLLNKIKWDQKEEKEKYFLTYRDNLAEKGFIKIPFTEIIEIQPKGISVIGVDFIPFHRILKIEKEYQVIWQKRK